MDEKQLRELPDSSLLDLLDAVSAEVKRRNSLSMSPQDPDEKESLERATKTIIDMLFSNTKR